MKVSLFLSVVTAIFALFAIVGASNPIEPKGIRQDFKSYLVTFTHPNTPDSVIESAIDSIIRAGGRVTHRFKRLIKGFSADAPFEALNTFSMTEEAQQWGMVIEEDSVVGITGQD